VIKEIELRDQGRRFEERVRLYGPDELAALLVDAGCASRRDLGTMTVRHRDRMRRG